MNKFLKLIYGNILLTRIVPRMASEIKPVELTETPVIPDLKRTCSELEASFTDHDDKKSKLEERIRKRKFAMMFAYFGVGYFGLQRNKGFKTIEGDIMEALYKAGLVNEEGRDIPQTISFQRAARTDKGVSALKQVVSLKLPEESNRKDINKYLPEHIRILSLKRVTKRFDSKNRCDARTYSYTCPTFSFAPFNECNEEYRLTDEQLKLVEEILKMYEGTHNYHNFTSKRKPRDPSCSRFIMKFEINRPFLKDGLELITLKVKGQSFMLHQIRKMVGVAMAIARGHTSKDVIEKAFGYDQLDLPVAPGLGLLLEQVHYDNYNEKFSNDGVHESLHFHEVDKEVKEFRQKYILPHVIRIEKEEKSMLDWLETLPKHSFAPREKQCECHLVEAMGAGDDDDSNDMFTNETCDETNKPKKQCEVHVSKTSTLSIDEICEKVNATERASLNQKTDVNISEQSKC